MLKSLFDLPLKFYLAESYIFKCFDIWEGHKMINHNELINEVVEVSKQQTEKKLNKILRLILDIEFSESGYDGEEHSTSLENKLEDYEIKELKEQLKQILVGD